MAFLAHFFVLTTVTILACVSCEQGVEAQYLPYYPRIPPWEETAWPYRLQDKRLDQDYFEPVADEIVIAGNHSAKVFNGPQPGFKHLSSLMKRNEMKNILTDLAEKLIDSRLSIVHLKKPR